MKTAAAILVELGKPLVVTDLDLPALKNGQALVQIDFAAICHTQLLEARGARGTDPYLPHCLGHEATGRVLETGPGVTKIKPGEYVVLSWIKGLGADAQGSLYRWGARSVNAGAITTFQRHSVISENRISRLPGELDVKSAVLLGCALPTGIGSVLNTAQAKAGESIAILGTGGVGLCAIIGAVAAQCNPIIAVDPNPLRRGLAERFGATHLIDPAAEDPVDAIRELSPGGIDIAIEATGIPAVMIQAIEAVRARGGRTVILGNAREGEKLILDPRALNDGKRILGCWGGDSLPSRDFPRFARLVSKDRVDLQPLLSTPSPLSSINNALDDLESGRVGRPLLDLSLQ